MIPFVCIKGPFWSLKHIGLSKCSGYEHTVEDIIIHLQMGFCLDYLGLLKMVQTAELLLFCQKYVHFCLKMF